MRPSIKLLTIPVEGCHEIFTALFIIHFCWFHFAQTERNIDSKVSAATVFQNRALVTRETEIDLEPGKHNFIISSLPYDLLDESVRISSNGNIKILDVEVVSRFTTEAHHDKIKNLENQIDSINQLIQIAADKILVYNSEREFIESLKAQGSKNFSERLMKINSTTEWNAMLKYIETNLSEIYTGLREQNRKKFLYEQKKNAITAEINNISGTKTKNYKEIKVNLESKGREKIKLFTSYLVQNASWYPLYDLRVAISDKNAELHYFGMVHQSTGEDWNNISVTLSTAEPMSVKSLPELSRWFLDINPPYRNISSYGGSNAGIVQNSGATVTYKSNYGLPSGTGVITGYVRTTYGEPIIGANVVLQGTSYGAATDVNGKFYIQNVRAGNYQASISSIGYQTTSIQLRVMEKNSAELTAALNEASIETSEISIVATRPELMKDMTTTKRVVKEDELYTNVQYKELSTNFEIPAKSTISSDNSPHKVTVAITNLPVDFTYTSIPKISPSVYLKGKVVNNKEYPFLEGEINIFVDNDFINKTSSKTIVPNDTLELALGVDDKIKAKKTLVNKFQETKGFLGGSRQVTYEYEIQLTNNRKTEENVLVYDQVPITRNEDITVKLLEPQKEIKELGNENKLEWKLNLKPGEKKTIPLKYQVIYPEKLTVYGLE